MVKVKICGITNQADYLAVINYNADYAGFVFYPKSQRFISPEDAALIKVSPKAVIKRVGVFVNASLDEIRNYYSYSNLDIIQLHGDESPEYCAKLGLPYWKAFRLNDENSINEIKNYNCDTILVDAYNEGMYGGTGKRINLNLVEKAMMCNKNVIVAGGLSNENIVEVLMMNPFAVDISSSIENVPGRKDLLKMKKLFEIIQDYRTNNETR